eukprot:CAMPEP_0115042098 /NCGR_PEP_ID=MMETSP0216-20121206/46066_1 /TAXON_ID=223996 /ORGANISM="Protocruzia adherens, Strain Boccale" /LENGTH=37 /DNA_ID= /DNA_START= /DNA_END= /DNA_ORIENTATION=
MTDSGRDSTNHPSLGGRNEGSMVEITLALMLSKLGFL